MLRQPAFKRCRFTAALVMRCLDNCRELVKGTHCFFFSRSSENLFFQAAILLSGSILLRGVSGDFASWREQMSFWKRDFTQRCKDAKFRKGEGGRRFFSSCVVRLKSVSLFWRARYVSPSII